MWLPFFISFHSQQNAHDIYSLKTLANMTKLNWFDTSRPVDEYMRQWTVSLLVQVMAWCLNCARPLPEPIITYCQLDPWEQTSVKVESKYNDFQSKKCIWKYRLQNIGLGVVSLGTHSLPIECSSHDGADALRVVTIDRRLFHSLLAQP